MTVVRLMCSKKGIVHKPEGDEILFCPTPHAGIGTGKYRFEDPSCSKVPLQF